MNPYLLFHSEHVTRHVDQIHDMFMAMYTYFELGTCREIWPDSTTENGMSNHFYEKWQENKKDPLIFWNRLDPINKAKVIAWYCENHYTQK